MVFKETRKLEKPVGRQQTTKVHVITVWLTLWGTVQAKHRQAPISRENRPEEKAPGRLAPTGLASSLLSGSQTALTLPSPLSALSSSHTNSYKGHHPSDTSRLPEPFKA